MQTVQNLKTLCKSLITEFHISADSLSFIINSEEHNWSRPVVVTYIKCLLKYRKNGFALENLKIFSKAYRLV